MPCTPRVHQNNENKSVGEEAQAAEAFEPSGNGSGRKNGTGPVSEQSHFKHRGYNGAAAVAAVLSQPRENEGGEQQPSPCGWRVSPHSPFSCSQRLSTTLRHSTNVERTERSKSQGMTRDDSTRSCVSSRSWIRTAAIGVASLALVATTPLATAASDPANFRGWEGQTVASITRAQAPSFAQTQAYHAFLYERNSGHRRLDTNASVNEAVEKANKVGASVRKAVKQLRGGTDKFYHDLITAVKIQLCNQKVDEADMTKNPKNRFVDASSDLAYKDKDDKCIQVQVTALTDEAVKNEYNQGHCEVKPNCYWSEIGSTDTERRPVWAITEAAQPADGAMTLQQSKDVLMKWAQGLMIFVVPGIILGALSLLTMIFFLLCRCCCNRCGGRSPKEGGYTCMQKFWPLFFYLLFAIGVVAVAGVSLLYQKTVTSAVSDTFQAASDTLGNGNKWIDGIEAPLVNIRDKVTSSADDVKTQLSGTDFIDTGLTGVTGSLTTFAGYSTDRTIPYQCDKTDTTYCQPCAVCTAIADQVNTAKQQVVDNAGAGVDSFKEVKKDLTELLVSTAGSVKNTVDQSVKMLTTLKTTITNAQTNVDDIQDQYEKQKAAQQGGVLGLFGLALAVIAIGFVGILFGLTPLKFLANIIHIAYVIGFIALFLTFIISSLFLAISVVLGDVCEVTSIFTSDWTVPLGADAKGVNACFKNQSLVEAFDLSSSLEFARGGVKFPDIKMDEMLDFSSLDTCVTNVKAKTVANFPSFDPAPALKKLNDATKQNNVNCKPAVTYDETTVISPWDAPGAKARVGTESADVYINRVYSDPVSSSCAASDTNNYDYTADCPSTAASNPCTFLEYVNSAYHAAKMLALSKKDTQTYVTGLTPAVKPVEDSSAKFKSDMTDFDQRITTIKTDLESSLIKYVGDFENAMYCTFIADGFYDIYEAMCGKLMPAFTMISLMLFLAGVFLFPVNVCLIIACKRLKARGNGGHVMDNEMKFK